MAFRTSSRRRVWFWAAISGCGLFAIVLPLLRADPTEGAPGTSDGRVPAARGAREGVATPLVMAQATIPPRKNAAAGNAASKNDRLAALITDTEQAARLLQDGKVEEFIEEFFPVNDLRDIREQTTVRQAARDPRLTQELLKRMAEVMALCAKAKPVLSQGDGVATFEVTPIPEKSAEIVKTPDVPRKAPVAEPLPGFGSDLKVALGKASQLLRDKDVEGFILGFFPLPEARHLKSSGELADLVYVIQENSQMPAAMQRDLQAMEQAKPVLKENDTIAEFTLKISTGPVAKNPPASPQGSGRGTGDTERIIRLQLIDGHWRLFDFASPVRKQINELSGKDADDSPEPIVVRWERFGNRWRLLALDFIEP